MEQVLFISHKKFLDQTLPEGGVRLCTNDYVELLQTQYVVNFLGVEYNRSILFRLRFRLGLDAYEEYVPENYRTELKDAIVTRGIRKVFINLSNAMSFGKFIKENFSAYDVKVILCSHGNESGDFLHQAARFSERLAGYKRLFSSYRLGKMLKLESIYRQHYIDLVLTVSEVEEQIEKWLGAKQVFMVPRVFKQKFIDWRPVHGRIGFVGDISHPPNYYGVSKLCEALQKNGVPEQLDFRIIGVEDEHSRRLKEQFSFVSIMGYMDNAVFEKEAASWYYYMNLAFYYSKGVSTKLAKGIDWGLPVISTTAGNRGYVFRGGNVLTADAPEDIATILEHRLSDPALVQHDRQEIINIVKNTITYQDIMKTLLPIIEKL